MSEEMLKDHNCVLYLGEVLVETGVLHEIESFLCRQGGNMFHVAGKAEARAIVENNNIAALVVDQFLPFGSGLDFMHWLHGFAHVPTIVIVKNQFATDTETVVALEAGAADAVNSDISARELAARIKACSRKYFYAAGELALNRYVFDSRMKSPGAKTPLYFAAEGRRLYFSDTSRIVLQPKEAEVMTLLINKYPAFIDREEISQNIFHASWNPNDRRIDNLISKLRKIVDVTSDEAGDSIIETVRNEGYRLRAPIALIPVGNNLSYVASGTNIMPS